MRIAIIAWGSLIWDPGKPFEGSWQNRGPRLPLEFSRVSKDGRLTLVVDYQNGVVVRTYYAVSARIDLNEAVSDLAAREGTNSDRIGFVDSSSHKASANGRPEQAMACAQIHSWIAVTDFDAAVWTALDSNFELKTGRPFTVENAIEYLETLPAPTRERALNYFKKAPAEVNTPLRRTLLERGLMRGKSEIDPPRQP